MFANTCFVLARNTYARFAEARETPGPNKTRGESFGKGAFAMVGARAARKDPQIRVAPPPHRARGLIRRRGFQFVNSEIDSHGPRASKLTLARK